MNTDGHGLNSKVRCAGPAVWTRTFSYDFVRKPLPPFWSRWFATTSARTIEGAYEGLFHFLLLIALNNFK